MLKGIVIWHRETNDRVKQDFIPNDVALGGELPNLVLLTGANMVHLFDYCTNSRLENLRCLDRLA